MREGIEQIETRNTQLEIQDHNYEKLHNTLGRLLADLALKDDVKRLLVAPDFKMELDGCLKAVSALDSAIRLNLHEGLESMQAVRDQRAANDRLKREFTVKAARYLESVFVDSARDAVVNRTVGNATVYAELKRYASLMRYLERLDFKAFTDLRPYYVKLMVQVYQEKIKLYFQGLQQTIHPESRVCLQHC
jgi:hypothetical protein